MLSWFDIIEPRRAVASVPRKVQSEREVAFAVWRDMAEEPEKYGEDIAEWLVLDAQLRAGPGHWRVHAYWLAKEAELEAKELEAQESWRALFSRIAVEAAVKGQKEWFRRDMRRILKAHRKTERKQAKAATKIQALVRGFLGRKRAAKKAKKAAKKAKKAAIKIQALVRGHLVRSASQFTNCCMCLSHRICSLKTDVGMMCRACGEDGPHTDLTGCDDPWDTQRGDYIDLANLGWPVRIANFGCCNFCNKDTEGSLGYFCSSLCQRKYDAFCERVDDDEYAEQCEQESREWNCDYVPMRKPDLDGAPNTPAVIAWLEAHETW